MEYNDITYEKTGAVLRVCHNRPDKGNAQSTRLLAELDDALARAKADSEVHVVIIGGQGKHFSAGHDLADGMKLRGDYTVEQHWHWEQEHFLGNAMRIWDLPKPTIAEVSGACIAGGFMVANSCDLALATMLEIVGVGKFLDINLEVLRNFTLVDGDHGRVSKPTNHRRNYKANRCRHVIDLPDDLYILNSNTEFFVYLT